MQFKYEIGAKKCEIRKIRNERFFIALIYRYLPHKNKSRQKKTVKKRRISEKSCLLCPLKEYRFSFKL